MDLSADLQKQIDLAKWINDHFSRPFSVDGRGQIAMACYDLAIEHHAAICALGETGLYGSMFALVRVEFEALGRGLWVRHSASEEDIEKYKRDANLGISIGTMLKLFEGQAGVGRPMLSDLKGRFWEILSSFTHTGYQAAVRRFNATHTGPVNYSESEARTALGLAGIFVIVATSELASLSQDEDLARSVLEMARKYAA